MNKFVMSDFCLYINTASRAPDEMRMEDEHVCYECFLFLHKHCLSGARAPDSFTPTLLCSWARMQRFNHLTHSGPDILMFGLHVCSPLASFAP
jgi:hypothetical protein